MRRRSHRLAVLGAALCAIAATALPVAAQTWPQRTVKLIIPLGAGAGADIGGRLVAERLQRRWDKSVVVENRPGGDSLVGLGAFVSANDDHTLFFGPTGSFTVHPYQHEKLPYDVKLDLQPIARVSNTILAIGIPASMGIGTLKELVARAHAEPGKLNAALVPGITEFVYDGFAHSDKVSMTKVPYRDIVQAGTDVGEGRIQFMMAALAILRPHVQGGRVKLLAVTTKTATPIAPGVPTAAEAGFPALEMEGLVGMFGPKGMALDLRQRIGNDVVATLADPEVADRLSATAQAVSPGGPEDLAKAMADQIAQVDAIAGRLGIKRKLAN